jgi:hypothetical protein
MMMKEAVDEIERSQVTSRWCDSTGDGVCYVRDTADIARAVFTARGTASLSVVTADDVFRHVKSVGGETGWYGLNFLWKLRGLMDKFWGGAGSSRGRRVPEDLRTGDAVDFWRIIDLVDGERLLLLSEMRLPGKAWLEFLISAESLVVTAYFLPRGLAGRLYWYSMLPIHALLFSRMAKNIVARAGIDSGNNNLIVKRGSQS